MRIIYNIYYNLLFIRIYINIPDDCHIHLNILR